MNEYTKVTGFDLRVTIEQARLLKALFESPEYAQWSGQHVGRDKFRPSQAAGLRRKIVQTGLAAEDSE